MTHIESAEPHQPGQRGFTASLSSTETASFATAIADLARSGLPLPAGLRAAAAEIPSRRSAEALRRLASQLEAGQSLEEALSRQRNRIRSHLGGLLLAGLNAGDLSALLQQWIAVEQQSLGLRREIRMVLAYPALLLLSLIAVVVFFCEFVARGMAEVIRDVGGGAVGGAMPAQSGFLFWLATTGRGVLWSVAAIVVFGPVLLWLLRRVPAVQAFLCSVPVLGPLWWWSALSDCCGLLGLLTARRMPLPAALDSTADAVNNAYIADGCRRLSQDVAAGRDLAAAIDRLPQFPSTLSFLLTWGHRHAVFPETCRAASEMFADRARSQLALVRIVVPPLTFLVVIGTFASLMGAILIPIVTMINKFSF
jgi:general secretion pathway protein F